MEQSVPRCDDLWTRNVPADVHHVCLIFDDDEQRRRIASGFLAEGLQKGELSRYAGDVTAEGNVRAWIDERLGSSPVTGALSFFNAASFYAPYGVFDPGEILGLMKPRWKKAEEAGHKGVRICGEMSWVLRGIAGSERFLEYEAGINAVSSSFPNCGMCLYDARLFDGATLFKVMQVHPFVIAHGQVVANPYYIGAEELRAQQRG